ncbi:MAG TPA: hypothetical protein VKR24_05260, partial [Candidatus Limnocylindrales bacterium]|nr:hypothetical protein [Candidatus Limnocylindrales bacterium]
IAPRAEVRVLDAPPVVGAALLGLDELGLASASSVARLRSSLVEAAIVRIGPGPGLEAGMVPGGAR